MGLANNLIDLEHLSYEPARNLNKNLIKELRSCRWITDSVPAWITITGATGVGKLRLNGVGKTYLMKALVKQAIEKSLPAAYFRYSDLLRNLEVHIENKDAASDRIMAKTTISITLKGPSLRAPEPKPEETMEKDIKR